MCQPCIKNICLCAGTRARTHTHQGNSQEQLHMHEQLHLSGHLVKLRDQIKLVYLSLCCGD